jgi:hypothetical protein
MEDMRNKGRQCKGEKKFTAKLTSADVIAIRDLFGKIRTKDIAEGFKIPTNQVLRIAKRKDWRHVP